MSKVAIVYWSSTGNTETMAKAVAEGAKAAGAETELFEIEAFGADKMEAFDAVAFGCPAMGDEELETEVFEPVFAACKEKLDGFRTALFGSYGWGDGEWMRSWEAQTKEAGADLVTDPVIANEAPDDEALEACRKLGAALA
jgi:flavodoxin short chain